MKLRTKAITAGLVASPMILGLGGTAWASDCVPSDAVPAYDETVVGEPVVETTDWLLAPPAGDGWVQIDERTVVDVAAVEGVEEVNHIEYRWALEKRTYTPAVEEQSHIETIVITPAIDIPGVPGVPAVEEVSHTEVKYVKQTREKKRSGGWTEWEKYGDKQGGWIADQSAADGFQVPGLYANGLFTLDEVGYLSNDVQYRYHAIASKKVVDVEAQPEIPAIPPVHIPAVTMDVKVVDVEYVPASFGPWEADGFTAWQTSSIAPADPDGQDGDDNLLNLQRVGGGEQRTVVDSEAVEAVAEVSHQEFRYSKTTVPTTVIKHPAVPAVECEEPELPHTGAEGTTWALAATSAALLAMGTTAVVIGTRRRGPHSD